jgi:serine/threonine protein kinase
LLRSFREAGIMCALDSHPNIVKMSGLVVEKESGEYSIVVQFCPGGSLDSFLAKSFAKLDEYAMFKLIYGICAGCGSLAKQNVIHRDLAARNILLGERLFPKISDFGYSRRVDALEKKGATNANIGPVPWMAPEQLRDRLYSEKSDVWAFGATVVEILTAGAKPYISRDAQLPSLADLALAIRDSGLTPLDCLDETITQFGLPAPPSWILELLPLVFAQDPVDRPSFHQITIKLKKLKPELAAQYENELDLANAIIVDSDDAELEKNTATREYGLLAPDEQDKGLVTKKSKKGLKTAKSKRKSKLIDTSIHTNSGPKFKILAKLGEGSFGVVSLGILEDGRYVAVKQVSGGTAESAAMYNEAKIMLSLKPDRNVIQVFGLTLEGDKLAIVMEFAAYGSLDSFVEKALQTSTFHANP